MCLLSNLASKLVLAKSRSILPVCFVLATTAGLAIADPIQVSEVVARQNAVAKTMPIVPPIAKQAHLAGRVVIELTVAEDGSVAKSEVVSGNPILGQAASRAGKSWTFKPFNGADGKPAQALVKLTFDFEAR